MTTRPKRLTLLALVFVGLALSFPLQLFWVHEHSLGEWTAVFSKLTWLNYLIMALALVNAWAFLRASRWMGVGLPLMILAVLWNNYLVGRYGLDFKQSTTLLASLGFCLLCLPVVSDKVRYLLADPKRRWWLRPQRHRKKVEATLQPYVGQELLANSFDISSGGLFLSPEVDQIPLAVGELTTLHLRLSQTRRLKCEARVVRVAKEAVGDYPPGVGLEFVNLERQQRSQLRELIH